MRARRNRDAAFGYDGAVLGRVVPGELGGVGHGVEEDEAARRAARLRIVILLGKGTDAGRAAHPAGWLGHRRSASPWRT